MEQNKKIHSRITEHSRVAEFYFYKLHPKEIQLFSPRRVSISDRQFFLFSFMSVHY